MSKPSQTPEEQRQSHAESQRRYAATPEGKAAGKRARNEYARTPGGIQARRRATQIQNDRKRDSRIHRQAVADVERQEQERIHGNHVRHVQAKQAGEPEYGHVTSDGTIEVRRV